MLSDLILGIFSIVLFFIIFKKNKNWGFFFFFMGISAIFGGLWHGYFDVSNNLLRFISWSFLTLSLIFPIFDLYKNLKIKISLIVLSSILLVLSMFYCTFVFMEINAIIVMLGFIMIKCILISNKHKGCKYVYIGILFSLISVLFQILKISFAQNMNYNDVGHYITLISLLIIFLGIKKSPHLIRGL